MGCYRVGISRLAMLLLSGQRDERGFWGNKAFNTFDVALTVIKWDRQERQERQEAAEALRGELQARGLGVLVDVRQHASGENACRR
jgi:prolyl-tRNA synthetase